MNAMTPLKRVGSGDEKTLAECVTIEVNWLEVLNLVRELYAPAQIFSETDLRQWAVENDYVLKSECAECPN